MYQFMMNAWYLFSAIGALGLAVLVILLAFLAVNAVFGTKDDKIPEIIRGLEQARDYTQACNNVSATAHIDIILSKLGVNPKKQQKW